MERENLKIEGIPTVTWGSESQNVIIAVHGRMSNKMDVPIEILAKNAVSNGYQVLSFDLPAHGDRKNEGIPCKVQNCVKDLDVIMKYAKAKWEHISVFAVSMGAYFSVMAYHDEPIERAWFLSPLVDMQRMINNMMTWFHISKEQLKQEKIIPTPIGETLYWDYYLYVNEHPVEKWNIPTMILRGSNDEICELDTVKKFMKKFSCKMKIVQGAEHYFQSEEEMNLLDQWFKDTMNGKKE